MTTQSKSWRIATACAILSICTWVVTLLWKHNQWKFGVIESWVVWYGLTTPSLGLAIVDLWHWKFRFRGRHPMAWALSLPFFWTFVPTLLYYAWHIERDRQKKGLYGFEAQPAPGSSTPGAYNIARSLCLVAGAALFVWGLSAACLNLLAHLVLGDPWLDTVIQHTGKPLSIAEVEAFQKVHGVYRTQMILATVGGASAAIGGILLALSFNFRWRLREQQESHPAAGADAREERRR